MIGPSLRMIAVCAIGLLFRERIVPQTLASRLPDPAALVMPATSLREIAVDFDAGRNVIYCFHGTAVDNQPRVHVDSVTRVASVAECAGIGIGLISRIADAPTIMAMLRGIIETHPEFRVVSAFYKTELIEVHGESMRAARALSVLRARSLTSTVSRS